MKRELFAWLALGVVTTCWLVERRQLAEEAEEAYDDLYRCGVDLSHCGIDNEDYRHCCADVYFDRAYQITDEVSRVCAQNGWMPPLDWGDFDAD